MTSSFRSRLRPVLAALLLGVAGFSGVANAEETLSIRLDQARVIRLPDRVSTIIVGNPLIADVSIQQGGVLVLTAKGYGTTNLIALDRGGAVLLEQLVQVRSPADNVVVVYRGPSRESYSCTPYCDRRITLGDSPEFFNPTIAQTASRNAVAGSTLGPR